MAIYDKTADPATAVSAWLSQFKVASTGAISYVSGSDTFHVYWIHRALQKIAWDFATSGDDEINLSYPNPSKSEALGTIITLYDHTSDFNLNYTVDETVMQYHFGGSVSINNGDDIWYGLKVLGKKDSSIPINIIQNHQLLTSHWGTGKNQTDANTLLRIMIKGRASGADIDHRIVHVRLNTFGYPYAIWQTTLDLGEAIASVSSESADPQNDTAVGTVRGYDVSNTDGYNLIDLDGNGDKPYIGKWDWGSTGSKKAVYEFVKAILADDSTDTLYGVSGKLWTGRLIDCSIGSGSGTWVQNETLSWGSGDTAGTGNLVAVDNLTGSSASRLVLHLNTGVAPANGTEITGNGGAKGTLTASPSSISTSVNHLGQFTGAWIGAYGIGFEPSQVTSADSFVSLNGDNVTPPNNVNITGTITCVDAGDDPHVFLAKKASGGSYPEYDTYTCSAASSGASQIDVDTIAADTPQHGYIGVLRTGTTSREYYEYDSWSGTTFNLKSGVTLAGDIANGDKAHHAYFYNSPTGSGTTKTVSNTLVYQGTPIDVIGWVRQGDEAAPDTWRTIAGTIGAGGFSFSVTLERES